MRCVVSFWDFLVWFFWFYIVISCIWIFITVFIDVFRSHDLSGWAKALWVIFLVFLPFLAAFIYLIARGKSMATRGFAAQQQAAAEQSAYIQAAAKSPTDDIADAKALFDSGALTQEEFDTLKAKALAKV